MLTFLCFFFFKVNYAFVQETITTVSFQNWHTTSDGRFMYKTSPEHICLLFFL